MTPKSPQQPVPLAYLPPPDAAAEWAAAVLSHPAVQQVVEAIVQRALVADRQARERPEELTLPELAERLDVAPRTIERRLKEVPALAALPCRREGRNRERRWVADVFLATWQMHCK